MPWQERGVSEQCKKQKQWKNRMKESFSWKRHRKRDERHTQHSSSFSTFPSNPGPNKSMTKILFILCYRDHERMYRFHHLMINPYTFMPHLPFLNLVLWFPQYICMYIEQHFELPLTHFSCRHKIISSTSTSNRRREGLFSHVMSSKQNATFDFTAFISASFLPSSCSPSPSTWQLKSSRLRWWGRTFLLLRTN